MRKIDRFTPPKADENPLFRVYQTVSFWRTFKNTLVIEFCRYYPWLGGKRNLYRKLLGMTIGEKTAIAFKVTPDLFYPEKITIGRNTVIGYHTTILTHEYLVDEYRVGEVKIGDEAMIGANVTILPGVVIGNRAVIGAGAVVSKDVPDDHFAFGNPLVIRPRKENR
ncbi:hexapeptide transferase [Listeria floridensis FSL S10-1187]|uniref:Hexapeptide transferase n=1 Tax=Listeria floridensis FSL S10-1187 TaxID=1265817 RepID=A0ABP3ATY1_9LIST|nr:acyltransferase [Listeria floridensis]EUJ25600.1 hexapeptide transferase [Listeria floridensis FSL S10-1187]